MTEHNLTVFLDECESLSIGDNVAVKVDNGEHKALMSGVVTTIHESRHGSSRTHSIEILDFAKSRYEYWELLYDRIPTLPQTLHRDFGIGAHLWQNIAHRVARTTRR